MNDCLCSLNLQIISRLFALALETGPGARLMGIILACLRVDTCARWAGRTHVRGQAGGFSRVLIFFPLLSPILESQLSELSAVNCLF